MSHLIRVGNSVGVRIPKAIISQVGFNMSTDLEFKVTDRGLLISPIRKPREGWEDAFKSAPKGKKQEFLLEEAIENKFDQEEWEW